MMVKKTLAICDGREITAKFKDEEEYERYCEKVVKETANMLLRSVTLKELEEMWWERNLKSQ